MVTVGGLLPWKINFDDKLALFADTWSPTVIGRLNDYEIKIVELLGELVWHSHADTDELFVVLDGELTIQFRDGDVKLRPREMVVVPAGIEHRPIAEHEVSAC